MRVEVFTAASAFHDLHAGWRQLLLQLPFQSVFFTPQWQETWWRHFGATRQLYLLTVRSNDGILQGLAPLMSSNGAPTPPRIELIGDLELCDYLDILMVPAQQQEIGRTLVEYLVAHGGEDLELCLQNLSQHSPTPAVFHDSLVTNGLTVEVEQIETCPTAVLRYCRPIGRRIWRPYAVRTGMSYGASCAAPSRRSAWNIGSPATLPNSTTMSTSSWPCTV